MHRKQLSGHCRSTVIVTILLLILCMTAAGAATVNTNLVANKVALVTTTQQGGNQYVDPQYYSTCPSGYDCLTLTDAAATLGAYEKYSDSVCGYKTSSTTATNAAMIPKYCVRKATTQTPVTCPENCNCITEQTAKDKGGTWARCSENVCGYEKSTATLAAVIQIPKYCMKQVSTGSTCPEGCNCITEAMAEQRYGDYTRCAENACGYEQDQTPKYCIKQGSSTPVCPDGCACISEEDAKLKGLTDRCDTSQTPCGFRTIASTAGAAANRVPLYCYKLPTTTTAPPVCPEGCYCLQEADAKLKFGANGYTRCTSDVCGKDYSATSANSVPKYCFRPITGTTTPVPNSCPANCTCVTNATAVEKGLTLCGNKANLCGWTADKVPEFCYSGGYSSACTYDYQKNACTGTCQQGYSCSLVALKKDESGRIVFGACSCTGQPASGQCTFDKEKQSCTGTCPSGAGCAILSKTVDEKTGAVSVTCGCPQPSSCVYDYSKDTCTGTCPSTGENCQLNTIYRDPTTGKVTFAECHCKGSGTTPATCAFNADHYCTGTCPQGGQCANTSVVDATGKQTFVCQCAGASGCVLSANNECTGSCATGAPCTRTVIKDNSGQEKVSCTCGGISPAGASPAGSSTGQSGGVIESIGSFFRKLFGGK